MALVLHPHYACGSENSHMYVFGGEKKGKEKYCLGANWKSPSQEKNMF